MKTITLIRTSSEWLARFDGDAEVMELFGTYTIPTAYTAQASPATVYDAIAKLNPEHVILMDGFIYEVTA